MVEIKRRTLPSPAFAALAWLLSQESVVAFSVGVFEGFEVSWRPLRRGPSSFLARAAEELELAPRRNCREQDAEECGVYAHSLIQMGRALEPAGFPGSPEQVFPWTEGGQPFPGLGSSC